MAEGPIFIAGLDRTGKTLLRLALSQHPNIHISKRTDLWVRFYNRFGDLNRSENFERCLQAILAHKHMRALRPDPERIVAEFWQGEHSYARLFAIFHQHALQRTGKLRWGDQSELIERYAKPIFAAYPQAKMIQMLRDPRDRYSASKQKWSAGKGKAGAATARWLYSWQLGQRNMRLFPDGYMLLRYENLVAQPEQTLEKVCTFLGEEFTPAMLLIGHVPGARLDIHSPDAPSQNHFLQTFVGEYRSGLSNKEIAFIQQFTRREMRQFGYVEKHIRFSTDEALVFYTRFLPQNILRMAAWKTHETMHGIFPRGGEKPLAELQMNKPAAVRVKVEKE